MSKTNNMSSNIVRVFYLVLVAFLMMTVTMGGIAQGFSLKMFTLLSPNLSIFPQNLTNSEKHQKLTQISRARAFDLQATMIVNSSSAIVPNSISSPTKHAYSDFYYTEMNIGTPPQKVNLALDPGSALTWVQCDGCRSCFPSSLPNFNIKKSTTSKSMGSNHPLCVPPELSPNGNDCFYTITYFDGSQTKGAFGLDTFTFSSAQGQQAIPNVAFGFGLFNNIDFKDYFHGHDNPIVGMLGLGRGHPATFIQQQSQITLLRFSYCLPPQFESPALLHFGDDAGIPSGHYTPILGGPNDHYYVKLNAISVNGARLQIDPSFFMVGGKGVAMDSGSPYSHIVEDAFKVLRQEVVDYFHNKYGWEPMPSKSRTDFDLCYQKIPTIYTAPSVTLHFDGGDLELHKPTLFQAFEQYNEFCMTILSMSGSESINVLGAAQQVNYRFLFDVGNRRLSFTPENC